MQLSNINTIELEYEQVLEEIGFGKVQWILLLISGLLTLSSMATQTSVGIMAISSQCEFEMSQSQKGIMMVACVAGVFLSTYFWGYISDAVGRRSVLLFGMFATNLIQFITMFVTNIWAFNIFNFIMGICLGGVSAAIYPYIGEFNQLKHRAIVINYSVMFTAVAAVYVPATCWWVLSADWQSRVYEGFFFRPWRLIILLNLLPGLIAASMLLFYPESPKLLLAHNKQKNALNAVEWICKKNKGQSLNNFYNTKNFKLKPTDLEQSNLLVSYGGCEIVKAIWKATKPLFLKPHVVNFIISVLAIFCMFFSYSGIQNWYPEIVNRSSNDTSGNSSTVCEILDASFEKHPMMNATMMENMICDDSISTKTYIDNIIVGCAFVAGFIIQGVLLGPIGRKNVLIAALSISTLSGILLYFVQNTILVLILFCLYILLPGLSISIILGAMVDLVPTNLSGKAVSICMTIGRLGVIVATNMIGVSLEPLCKTTFAIFTCAMLVSAVLVKFLPI